jgi:signal transduction histidine kinase
MLSRPKLRTILLILSLIILLLPLGGIAVLRLYENELIKQTESELISQAVLIAAYYKQEYLSLLDDIEGQKNRSNAIKGNPVSFTPPPVENPDGLTPVLPELDLAISRIYPPADTPLRPDIGPEPLAKRAVEKLIPVIIEAKKTNLSGIRIVDYQGIVIASSGEDVNMSLASRQEIALALQGKPNSLLRKRNSDSSKPSLESISRGTRLRVFVALPVIIENQVIGVVITSRTPLDVAKALYASRIQLLKGSLFIIGAVLLMTILTSYYIRRPVKALLGQVDQIKIGNKKGQTPIDNPAIEEVAQLSDAIAQMAVTLEQRAEYIRTFAANVSHEFKTPLTSLRGAIEILKDHYSEMNKDERENFLKIIDDEAHHLDMLVKRLLELARAEVYKHDGEVTTVRPVLERIIRRYSDKNLKIQVNINDQIENINMSPEIFSSILSNLLDNTLLHNSNGCNVNINITFDDSNKQNQIRMLISDDGKGISEANVSRIFRPFFTTARDRGGSGLGLTIIKSLIEAHGGTIEFLPVVKGASFLIKLYTT